MCQHAAEILVLTLYSGEAEFERCLAALAEQIGVAWEHRVFEHLPNAEAHSRLYSTIMAESERYKVFFKLDADMVLTDPHVLADLVEVFKNNPSLDHLVVAVSDWMTQSYIIGAHLFSHRVSWRDHVETLYVDPDPHFEGTKVVVSRPPRDLISHCDDPSPLQAFHFGAHRALQASQVYRSITSCRPHNARIQWTYLEQVWRHLERSQDRRLALAILAADLVFQRQLPETVNEYSDPALLAAFQRVAAMDDKTIRAQLESRWGTRSARLRTWRQALGGAKWLLVAGRGARDAAASLVKAFVRSTGPVVEIGSRG
jgi:hypothetical protein